MVSILSNSSCEWADFLWYPKVTNCDHIRCSYSPFIAVPMEESSKWHVMGSHSNYNTLNSGISRPMTRPLIFSSVTIWVRQLEKQRLKIDSSSHHIRLICHYLSTDLDLFFWSDTIIHGGVFFLLRICNAERVNHHGTSNIRRRENLGTLNLDHPLQIFGLFIVSN